MRHAAVCLKLRRVTTRSNEDEPQIFVMLTTLHSCTAHERVAAWASMLKVVNRESASKWLITGFLATQEIELAINIRQIKPDLNPTRVFSSDKTLACVAQGIDLASCQNHDEKQNLVVEVDNSGVDTTCSESNVKEEHAQVQLTPFYDCFVKVMKNTKDDGIQHLVPLLYGPRLPFRWAEDGTLVLPAPTQWHCERKLDIALNLLNQARYQAQKGGALTARPEPADDHRKLSSEEMDKALSWLKSRYQEDYMTCAAQSKPTAVRSGFRTFLRDIIGDASIAYAILRNGFSTPEALLALTREIFEAHEKAKAKKEANPHAVTKKSHPDLAAAAKKARKDMLK